MRPRNKNNTRPRRAETRLSARFLLRRRAAPGLALALPLLAHASRLFLAAGDSSLVNPKIAVDAAAHPLRQVKRALAQFTKQEELNVAFLHLPDGKKGWKVEVEELEDKRFIDLSALELCDVGSGVGSS